MIKLSALSQRTPAIKPLLLLSALVTLSLQVAHAQNNLPFHPAQRADDFVESIGVATHWGYSDTPYGYAYENVKALLAASGIRYVRDGFHPHLSDLYHSHGIRTTLVADPGDVEQTVETIKANRDLIAMVEGPNEVALFPRSAAYQGMTFPDGPRHWMNDLYRALKAEPETRSLPIIAPSTGKIGANAAMSPLNAFDLCVMHSYAGGNTPSNSLYSDINNNIMDAYSLLGEGAILKPLAVTESGYHTALGSSVVLGGAQPGVSERAQAKYLPRHFAEYFNAGVVRTYTYEFLDEFEDYKKDEHEATNAEACFGIVKHDLTPKPAYIALTNLISLLAESHWDAATQRWIRPAPEFAPRALPFALSGNTINLHHTLLQKADGEYYLLLWQEVPSFDLTKREDVSMPDAQVTLSLLKPSTLTIYRPDASVSPVRAPDVKATSVTLDVPDEVVVVRIAPPSVPVSSRAIWQTPLRLSASATRDTATLSWKYTGGNHPAALFISRLGRLVAEINDPKQSTLTETGLLPGKGYPYQIVATDDTGNLSVPLNILVQTKAEYPDLVITDVGFVEKPVAGQVVRLTATLKNIGNAATPGDTVHGVAFYIDGQFICWSDDFKGPLKPGESKKVTSNNGPKGLPHWVAVSGNHTLRAIADDVHRLPEKTHDNNTREVTVSVP
jgi:hypothetical protein